MDEHNNPPTGNTSAKLSNSIARLTAELGTFQRRANAAHEKTQAALAGLIKELEKPSNGGAPQESKLQR